MGMDKKESFDSRARSRHLVVPDKVAAANPKAREVLWDGKLFHLLPKGEGLKASTFTYCNGENMVGFSETPSTATTRLIGGRYRCVNEASNVKEGNTWSPGNRFSHRLQKLDADITGEAMLAGSKLRPLLIDSTGTSLFEGKLCGKQDRFSHLPGRTSYPSYEHTSHRLQTTSKWSMSRPPSHFRPGFSEFTTRPINWEETQAAMQPPPPAPAGTYNLREANGDVVTVPVVPHLAAKFGNERLVPNRVGAIPNGPAAYSVHATPARDLKWLTRVTSQRTSGNAYVRGPADVDYFERNGFDWTAARRQLATR